MCIEQVTYFCQFTWMFFKGGQKDEVKPMWAKLMSKADLEEPTQIIDQVYLGCTQRESETNKRIVTEKSDLLHKLVSSKYQPDYAVQQWHQARRVVMELRPAGSCTKVCWRLLRIGEQHSRQIAQRIFALFGWPPIQEGGIGKWENYLKFGRESSKHACIQLALADGRIYGSWMFWQDMWRNGTEHAMSD